MKKYLLYTGILALGLVGCEPEFENPVDAEDAYSSGEADLSTYVALGNSLTAGYADNSLYLTGQLNSYPNILAQQFAKAGGGTFTQPLVADNAGGLLLNGEQLPGFNTRLVLAFNEQGSPSPRLYNGETITDIAEVVEGPFNNFGVPGAKSYHLAFPGYGNLANLQAGMANPYFIRFASTPNASVIGDALEQEPTFFSLWIGNNDVLGYATSGGTGLDQTGNPNLSVYGPNDITDPQVFAGAYTQLVQMLTDSGAEGVLINIPNVADIPFFTTVPYAPLDPTNQSFGPQIPSLNEMYSQLNQAFAFLGVPERSISFSEAEASAVVIKDESLTDISQQLTEVLKGGGMAEGLATIYGMQFGQARQATPEDLLVLTSSGAIGQVNMTRVQELVALGLPQELAGKLAVNGVTYPMEDRFVLVPEELEAINTARLAYNAIIQNLANTHTLAYVDAAGLLNEAEAGIPFDGGVITSDFVTGGAFSLDGIHLTPRGYALVANEIIEEVNETYNATVPKVNVGAYGTITPSNDVD